MAFDFTIIVKFTAFNKSGFLILENKVRLEMRGLVVWKMKGVRNGLTFKILI
jgi:hypothetical protein